VTGLAGASGPGDRALADRATSGYVRHYGVEPDGVWFAPGRANLIGEHTDYNEGFVLPFALSSGVAVAAGRRDDEVLAVWSQQETGQPVTAQAGGLAPGTVSGWAAYPLGVAWSLRAAGYPAGGTSMAVDANLAMGAGLSSSAAIECAVGLALTELHDLTVPRTDLAALASRAENHFAGAPTGVMDQSASLLSQAGQALLLDCRSGESALVPLDPVAAGMMLLVIDTRVRHELNDGRYAERRESCEEAAGALGVPSLRDVTGDPEAVGKLADPVLRRRARHVVTENARVLAAVALLRKGALAAVGPVLSQSHESLRHDFEVSWPQADTTVAAVLSAGGAGARMMGGGFGGSVLALVPAGRQDGVRAAVEAAFARHDWPAAQITEVAPSASARRLR
jgi:galactokinase